MTKKIRGGMLRKPRHFFVSLITETDRSTFVHTFRVFPRIGFLSVAQKSGLVLGKALNGIDLVPNMLVPSLNYGVDLILIGN